MLQTERSGSNGGIAVRDAAGDTDLALYSEEGTLGGMSDDLLAEIGMGDSGELNDEGEVDMYGALIDGPGGFR